MADELVTVSEMADKLGTTKTRLRRLLSSPKWKGYVSVVSRETRTGTRAAQCLPASLLPALEKALEERDREQAKPTDLSVETSDLYRRVIREQEERIKALEAQAADLAAMREKALSMLEQERERTARFLEPQRQRTAIPLWKRLFSKKG